MKNYIPLSELQDRRNKLGDQILPGSLFLLLSNQLVCRNADVDYPFRQNSDFWYFTGLDTPDSAFALFKDLSGEIKTVIFTQDRDFEQEKWLGQRFDKDLVQKLTGIKNVLWFSELQQYIQTHSTRIERIYFDQFGSYQGIRDMICNLVNSFNRRSQTDNLSCLHRTNHLIWPLRLVKSVWEIEQMQKACDVNISAHTFASNNLAYVYQNGDYDSLKEKRFEADLYYIFNQNGLNWSYPAIVASGKNGCVLHYGANNDRISPENFLLVDAGCEYNYYASDITRCYHPSGHLTNAQKQIYDLVRQTNLSLIEYLGSGQANYLSYHQKSVELISQGLLDIGLLKGSIDQIIEDKLYTRYYMHGIGHWLGLDVHDNCRYLNSEGKRINTPLSQGMTLTVEPGVYIHPEDELVHKDFRGLAVRIEDNIAFESDSIINLTEKLPK